MLEVDTAHVLSAPSEVVRVCQEPAAIELARQQLDREGDVVVDPGYIRAAMPPS
jgi:hypothetical protein